MKTKPLKIVVIFLLFSGLLIASNPEPELTADRSNTFYKIFKESQQREVTSAKCQVRPQTYPPSEFKEQSVSGSFSSTGAAKSALDAKIKVLYGNTSLDQTDAEFGYGGWEGNGRECASQVGNNSSGDYEAWTQANSGATVKSINPSLPCDGPDPGCPNDTGSWQSASDSSRYRLINEYFKFSYKITYTKN